MRATISVKNLHDLLGTVPFYPALFLTGASISYKLNEHAYNPLGNVACRPCERFLLFYNGKDRDKYRIRPRHPACAIGIDIIKQHFQLQFSKVSTGRHAKSYDAEAA